MIDPSKPTAHAARLSIRGPVIAGLAVIALFFGGGVVGAAWMPIDKGASLSGTIIVESKSKPVQHQRGGTVSRLHVKEGDEVKAGDLIVTLDTAQLDEQVTALKAQSRAANRQLELIRQEAAVMANLAANQLASRSKVLALERQVAEVEKEVAGVQSRIAVAEQESTRAEVRAPVAGKLLTLAVRGRGEVVTPGGTIAEIVPRDERLVVEGRLSPALIDLVKPGQVTKVWLAGLSWREQRPLLAKVAWVSADSVEDKRSGIAFFVTRIELDDPKSELVKRFKLHPGQRTEILVLTGERTLLDHILDPILRNINRAFRA
jgi:multidrug efflux pump subunit AcrA (membrane-fusion protein)